MIKMSKRIKEEIRRFKAENGNANLNMKEMLWYLMGKMDKTDDKIDKIYEKFEKGAGKISANRESIKSLKWILGILLALFSTGVTILIGILT